MSVQKDNSGRRSVDIQLEVPGNPEEIWQAIATASGIASWFVPAQFEEQDGQPIAIKLNFGLGMEARLQITQWQAPNKWASKSDGWTAQSPPVANEWIVEARAGGKCSIRIVYSHFADTDDWDHELEGAKASMFGFLRTLQIYLTHFRGQRGVIQQILTPVDGSESEAWNKLISALGLQGLGVGQRFSAAANAPSLSGIIEHYSENPFDALLRLDKPIPGIAALGAFNCGHTVAGLNLYLYGEAAPATIAQITPLWEEFLRQQL